MIQDWKGVEKESLNGFIKTEKIHGANLMTPGSLYDGAETVARSFQDTIVFQCKVCGDHIRKPFNCELTGEPHGKGWEYADNIPCKVKGCGGSCRKVDYAAGGACAALVADKPSYLVRPRFASISCELETCRGDDCMIYGTNRCPNQDVMKKTEGV